MNSRAADEQSTGRKLHRGFIANGTPHPCSREPSQSTEVARAAELRKNLCKDNDVVAMPRIVVANFYPHHLSL